jgi:hypothetical protein
MYFQKNDILMKAKLTLFSQFVSNASMKEATSFKEKLGVELQNFEKEMATVGMPLTREAGIQITSASVWRDVWLNVPHSIEVDICISKW